MDSKHIQLKQFSLKKMPTVTRIRHYNKSTVKSSHFPTAAVSQLQNDQPQQDHVTNEEVPAKIQQVIGPHVDLLDHRKETQTAVVSSRLPLNRSGDGLARPRLPLIWSGLSMWQGTVKG